MNIILYNFDNFYKGCQEIISGHLLDWYLIIKYLDFDFLIKFFLDFFRFKVIVEINPTLELLFPELILLLSILSLLFLKPNKSYFIDYNFWFFELWKFCILSLITYIFLKSIQLWKYPQISVFLFNNYWFEDTFTIMIKILLACCMLFTLGFSFFYSIITNNKKIKLRILFFLMFTIIFLFALIMSFDLFGIYLCIEGLTLVLTTLIASNLTRISIESGLKYILLSAFSSCLLLLSIGLFVLFFGTTNLLTLKILINSYILNPGNNFFFLSINIIFLKNINYLLIFFFLSLLFKLSAWPCCFWVPDIYSGSPMPIIFFFATTLKLIFFMFFIRFVFFTFFSYYFFLKTFFLIIAISTTGFGILGSLFQNKLKIFIAFSGISHIGLIFFALSSFNFIGIFSAIFYILFYISVTFILFGFILNINLISYHKTWGIKKFDILYISDLKGIFFKQKFYGSILIGIFLFLAGIPPFISFFGKFWIYITLYLDRQYTALIFLFFLSLMSTFYYLWWVRSFIFDINKKRKNINYICFSFTSIDIYSNKYLLSSDIVKISKIIRILFLFSVFFLFVYTPVNLLSIIDFILILTKQILILLDLGF